MRISTMPLSTPRNRSAGQTTGFAAMIACVLLLVGCGGGGNNAAVPPPPVGDPQFRVSGTSPLAAGCDGAPAFGTLYVNAEVEPMVALNPRNANHVVGVWQQDRWSTGGARGLLTGVSLDGGRTWTQHMAAFSHCTGGSAANGGDYSRASDPWVTFAPMGRSIRARFRSTATYSRRGRRARSWSVARPTAARREQSDYGD